MVKDKKEKDYVHVMLMCLTHRQISGLLSGLINLKLKKNLEEEIMLLAGYIIE